jgi:dTDP-4-dehydrorhamnose reductase
MRYLVAGATGQLGRALLERLGDEVVWSGGSGELDVTDEGAVSRVVRGARPDVVINAAAWNDVDGAESNPQACFAVNASGPLYLARAASAASALLVHVSTDYVFDGNQTGPYSEDDCPRPLSVYGCSKLAGEHVVRASGCPYLVVRTSALYGKGGSRAKGGSFVERILARARAGEGLRVVGDQVVSPTYAPDLAAAISELIRAGARGLFHVTNSGSCTWYTFAETVLKEVGIPAPMEQIRTRDLDAAARRPAHAILSKERYEELGLDALRPWSEALGAYVADAGLA